MLPYSATSTIGTQNNAGGQGDYTTLPFPAAVGGLNRRDGKADMPITDANILTNVVPRPTFCEVRRGNESYATGLGASVQTLMEWAGPSREFYAAAGTDIWDITSPGAASSAVSGLTNAIFQWVNFATAGGNFLVACNGADPVQNYNGSAWSEPVITGVSSADLINVGVWKNRLWFVEKNTQVAWYLPVNSIAGAATSLNLGPQFKRGGRLVFIGTFSHDTGTGPDDFLAFVSDQGEVAVYQGTDPSSATTFQIVGRFQVGSPCGGFNFPYRCGMKVGGDLALITIDGIVSLIKMMQLDRSVAQREAITNKIQDLFNEYAVQYRENFGWTGQIFPLQSLVVFNIPFSSTQYNQLVMNTETGAWCEFENWNGSSFGLYNDELYYGGTNGVVYKAYTGNQDNGGVISFDYQGAFNNFGLKSRKKFFQLIRPLINTNGSPAILMTMNVDFADTDPTGTLNPTAPPTSTWDSGLWDSAMWGGTNTYYQWYNVGQLGAWGTPRLKGALNGITLQINSFEVKFTVGGVI